MNDGESAIEGKNGALNIPVGRRKSGEVRTLFYAAFGPSPTCIP
jgi:hypothetical protein